MSSNTDERDLGGIPKALPLYRGHLSWTMSAFGHGYPNHVLIKGIEHFVEKAVG